LQSGSFPRRLASRRGPNAPKVAAIVIATMTLSATAQVAAEPSASRAALSERTNPEAGSDSTNPPSGSDTTNPELGSASRCPPHTNRRALAIAAALVPGIVVHGAGHWVLCDDRGALRLLEIEGIGLGVGGLAGAGLGLTGASRYFVAPLAIGALGGGALFLLSWLADVYAVAVPDEAKGRAPTWSPRLTLEAGARYVYDPQFAYRAILTHSFHLDADVLWVEPRYDVAVDAKNRRYSLLVGRRLLGPRAGSHVSSGTHLDVSAGVTDHAYGDDGFSMTIAEVSLRGRLDLDRVNPSLRGSFVEGQLGYARQWSRFVGFPDDSTDELLARAAFGVYWGYARGESYFAYDHRRDTFAGGLRMGGRPAGYLGFLEQRNEVYFGSFGAALEFSYGSAFIASASALFRIPP
jgi:hypothetical protein